MAATFTPTFTTSRNAVKHRYWEGEILYVPGDPGDTYNEGDLVTFTVGEGIADAVGANELPMGVVAPTPQIVCPSSTSAGFPRFRNGSADIGKILTDEMKTLVPIIPWCAMGTQIRYVRFEDYLTDDVASYSSSGPYAALTTGVTANDYPNGALVLAYSGTGIGQWNVVADYVHTGGSVELQLDFHRKFSTDLDSTTDLLILAGEGATNKGVGFFGRTGPEDSGNVEVDQHADDGVLCVFADARTISYDLERGLLPVVHSTAMGLLA